MAGRATFLFSARMVWRLDLRQSRAGRVGSDSHEAFTLRTAVDDAQEGYRFLPSSRWSRG